MAGATVIIAGMGMLGSWTAHALARAVGRLIVYDGGDTVEAENLGNQAYNELHVREPKGASIASELYGFNVDVIARMFPYRTLVINGREVSADVVVSCVDTLEGRAAAARWCQDHRVPLFIDTRAQGEVAVICTAPPDRIVEYLLSMPKAKDVEDRRCGAVGGAYTGMWVASQVAATINGYYKGLPVPKMLVWHTGLNQEIKRLQ